MFTSLRAEKIGDPDFWKLVSQLAEIEQEENRYGADNDCLLFHLHKKRIGQVHIRYLLGCLNREDLIEHVMRKGDPYERNDAQDGVSRKRNCFEDMENAVFNLVSACAAIEKGCWRK